MNHRHFTFIFTSQRRRDRGFGSWCGLLKYHNIIVALLWFLHRLFSFHRSYKVGSESSELPLGPVCCSPCWGWAGTRPCWRGGRQGGSSFVCHCRPHLRAGRGLKDTLGCDWSDTCRNHLKKISVQIDPYWKSTYYRWRTHTCCMASWNSTRFIAEWSSL